MVSINAEGVKIVNQLLTCEVMSKFRVIKNDRLIFCLLVTFYNLFIGHFDKSWDTDIIFSNLLDLVFFLEGEGVILFI